MRSVIQTVSMGLVLYVVYGIYQSPLASQPTPFWDIASDNSFVDGKIGIFLILFGIIALLMCGGLIYSVLKVFYGLVQQTIESIVPAQLKITAPLVAMACLLYPVNIYKSEVKQISMSTAMQVNAVLEMSDDYDVHAKQKEEKIDV